MSSEARVGSCVILGIAASAELLEEEEDQDQAAFPQSYQR